MLNHSESPTVQDWLGHADARQVSDLPDGAFQLEAVLDRY